MSEALTVGDLGADHLGKRVRATAKGSGLTVEGVVMGVEHGCETLDSFSGPPVVLSRWTTLRFDSESSAQFAAGDAVEVLGADLTAPRRRRLASCVAGWPEAETGAYDPRCCRFPKSCSADVYDEQRVTDVDLEP